MNSSRKYVYPLLILVVTTGFYFFEDYIEKKPTIDPIIKKQSFFYLPTSTTNTIIVHDNYSLSYSEANEQAEWVAYELKKSDISRNEFKRPYFIEDKKIKSKSASWRNYKKSGYDKGHLCPAGDRKFSYDAFNETFLTSNISPQEHDFNGGVWNRLEKKVRKWAVKYDGVYVITGGVLKGDLESIGSENVSVPKYFYKIIFDNNMQSPKMIGFLIPHQKSNEQLEKFVVTVDEIEKITGIDFFPKLEDAIETKLEAAKITKNWMF